MAQNERATGEPVKEIGRAEILCVGTELLLGDIINTNAAYIARRLADLGIPVYRQAVVGDNPGRLTEELLAAFARSDLVVLTGGLGPTCDDLTKETVAALFDRPMEMDAASLREMERFFAATGREMTKNNEKQALLPQGCEVFSNTCGTAPGLALTGNVGNLCDRTAILLPGPPREMKAMFEASAFPFLKKRSPHVLVSRNLHLIGIGESAVESLLRPLMEESCNPTLAPYAKDGEVRLRITARGSTEEEAAALCEPLMEKVKNSAVGAYIYGIDVDSVENAVFLALRADHETLATAESCTGGRIADRLTALPGISEVYPGGDVTYACAVKTALAGVEPSVLEAYGAVSEPVARQMAAGIRKSLGTDFGLAATGFAGPGGGTEKEPVGTVYIAADSARYGTCVRRLSLSPMRDREYIRTVAATQALSLILALKKEYKEKAEAEAKAKAEAKAQPKK